jgi:hypothetical protein
MTLNELLLGSAICVVMVGLALASSVVLDRYLPIPLEQKAEATVSQGSPCVDTKGFWVNWPWANVPALSPPCPDAKK